MQPAMYIILNQDAGMSTGKAAAQASHAAVEAYRLSMSLDPDKHLPPLPHMNATTLYERNLVRLWYKGGHYTKIVLGTYGDLSEVSGYLIARGFTNAVIVDEGRTELDPFTPTAIGCAIVDKDNPHTQAVFGEFKLYKDPEPRRLVVIECDGTVNRDAWLQARDLAREGKVEEAQAVIKASVRKRSKPAIFDKLFPRS